MPYCRLETNQEIRNGKEFALKMSKVISSVMGKPEGHVMVSVFDDMVQALGGTHDNSVFVELRAINLDDREIKSYSAQITDFLSKELLVPPARVFINFIPFEADLWGYNGATF